MSATAFLSVLGGFGLRVGGGDAPALPRKTRALLAFLALQPRHMASREAVGELLWSDRGEDQMRHSLRQALAEIRRQHRDAELLLSRDGMLSLAEWLQSDVGYLLGIAADSDLASLQRAADAYAGPLLAGLGPVSPDFDDWLVVARARLENQALECLARLTNAAAGAGDHAGAVTAAERMFALDPLREDTHRRLLETCAAAGRRSEALRHYAAIVEVLRRELGVAPAKETRDLAQRLRHEMDPVPAGVPAQAASAGGAPPIAVLPFQMLGTEIIPSHLADGLVADIVCQLSGLRELSVISHGSTFGMRDAALDPQAVGRMLGVRYVVRGAIRRAGNSVRLTTELADAETGKVVWARTHDADALASFADQDRVVAQVVNTLAPRVHEAELRRIRGKRPDSLTVYEKTLLAREHILKLERDDFIAARLLLDEAIAAEPDYAEAHALLADWHALFMSQGWSSARETHVAAMDQLTQRALLLDGENVRALVAHAHRKSLLHRAYGEACAMFEQALALSPNSAQAWLWSSFTYSYMGDGEQGVARAERALQLSPRDRQAADFYSACCVANYTAGNYLAAADWGQRALASNAVLRATYRWTAASLVAAGQNGQAREVARQGMAEVPNVRIRDVISVHPYRDHARRDGYARHLLAAGFAP